MVTFDAVFAVAVFAVFLYLFYKIVVGVLGSPKTITDSEWRENSKEEARQMLVEDIGNAEASVHIVSGNCDSEIYGSDSVMMALQNARVANPKLDICILTGPIDLRWNKSDRETFEKNVTVVVVEKGTESHFRVVDKGKRIYVESPQHLHTTDSHVYKRSFKNGMAGALLEQKFWNVMREKAS